MRRLVLPLFLTAQACGPAPTETAPVVFETEVAAELRRSCASCHTTTAPSGQLSLDSNADDLRSTLVRKPAHASSLNLVEPGDPERSFLYLKVAGTLTSAGCGASCGSAMPPGATFDKETTSALERWILEGAN